MIIAKTEEKEIFSSWVRVLVGHTGKRFASIYKKNDTRKNIYTLVLEKRFMTPEEEQELEFFTKKRALDVAYAFLDTDSEEFYWSESISQFIERISNEVKKNGWK